MIEIYKTQHHHVFSTDHRFKARQDGFLVGVRWNNCRLIARQDEAFDDHMRHIKAAEHLWGPWYDPHKRPPYYVTEQLTRDKFWNYWTFTMYLKDQQHLTLLTLAMVTA
jgi:hypothetical protein